MARYYGGPLRRSIEDRMIAGVCGGIAEYYGISAFRIRLIYAVGSFLSVAFPGILVYVILWFLIPKRERF